MAAMSVEDGREYSLWDEFDSRAYIARLYTRTILPEDTEIMRFIVGEIRELGIDAGQLRRAADVGAGPNLYPALLLSPYVADDGLVDLIDMSANNVAYLEAQLSDTQLEASTIWSKFEAYQQALGHDASLKKIRRVAVTQQGSIFDLPVGIYDAVLSFFALESVADLEQNYRAALESLMSSLKPGGLFITAHVVGCKGYLAGPGRLYPTVNLSYEQITASYEPYGPCRTLLVTSENREVAHTGCDGLTAVVGVKSVKETETGEGRGSK